MTVARIQYIVESSLYTIWLLVAGGLLLLPEPKWSWWVLALLGIFILNIIVLEVLKRRGVWVKTKDPGSKVGKVIRTSIFSLLLPIYRIHESFVVVGVLYAIGLMVYENLRIYRANFVNPT